MNRLASRAAFVLVVALAGCAKPPVKIGFLGGLSGRQSELGVTGRNGAQLAVELRDAAGGIDGRKVEFIGADDGQDAATAAAAFAELAAGGVSAVVGPMTSDMALAVIPAADKAGLLLISPTASSPKLSGLDDQFIRVNPVDSSEGRELARYFAEAGHRSVAVALDLSNRTFAEGTDATVRSALGSAGPRLERIDFDSRTVPDYAALAARAEAHDATLVVAAAVDAANLVQVLRRDGYRGTVYGTGWSMTDDYVKLGGDAAEGTVFSHYFDRDSSAPAWQAFRAAYRARFGAEPDFTAGLAANAAMVAMEGLERGVSRAALKDAVISRGLFEGLQGDIRFDRYGECELERFRLEVRDGRIRAIR